MTFLTPIPAIIAAAITVPLLLIVYFLKLRRLPIRVSSVMLWDKAAADLQANVPFQWLKASLLLLLQLLVLALFLLALARPVIHSSSGLPDQIFIVLDTSASMKATDALDPATDQPTTRFAAAKALAQRAVKVATRNNSTSTITLLSVSNHASIIAGPSRSRRALLEALNALVPTDAPSDMAAALTLINALIERPANEERSDDDSTNRATPKPHGAPLILLCTDGNDSSEDTTDTFHPPPGTTLRYVRPPLVVDTLPTTPTTTTSTSLTNAGIVRFSARRDAATPARIHVFAQILSTYPKPTTLAVSLGVNGQIIKRSALTLEPATTPSGLSRTPVSFMLDQPGSATLTLTLETTDSLAADNRASLTIEAARRPRVVLVREDQREDAGTGWLLTDVLRELDLAALTLISTARLDELGPRVFADYDLAIYDDAPAAHLPPIPSIHFGKPPAIPATLVPAPGPDQVEPVIWWDRNDPLLTDLSLDGVRIGHTFLLSEPSAETTTNPPATPTHQRRSQRLHPLVRTPAGSVMARLNTGRISHILTGFSLIQSNWPLDPSFALFLANAIDALPSQQAATYAHAWTTNDAVTIDLPSSASTSPAARFDLIDPTGATVGTYTLPDQASSDQLRLGQLDRTGLWQLKPVSDSSSTPIVLPVNLFSAVESSLSSPRTLPLTNPTSEQQRTTPNTIATRQPAELTTPMPQELWPHLLIAAVVLLVLEWILYARRVRV